MRDKFVVSFLIYSNCKQQIRLFLKYFIFRFPLFLLNSSCFLSGEWKPCIKVSFHRCYVMSRFSNLEGSIYYPSSQPTHLLSRSFNVVTAKSACLVYICFTEVYEKYCEYNLALPPSRTSFLREKYCPRPKKFSKICLTWLSHRVTQPAVFHRNAMRENFQHGGQREALSSISHAVFAPEHSIRQDSENERI